MSKRLRIIQPRAGVKVDDDSQNEKWLVVELKLDLSLKGFLTWRHYYEWLSKGFILWGTYAVKGNHTRNDFDGSFYIGEGEPTKTIKIWRYKPMEQNLYFATIKTGIVGGGLKYGEQTDAVREDLVLYRAISSGENMKLPNGVEYSNGFVDVPSWIEPFEKRTIYWRPNDIELGH